MKRTTISGLSVCLLQIVMSGLMALLPPNRPGEAASFHLDDENLIIEQFGTVSVLLADRQEGSQPEEASATGGEKSTAEGQSDSPSKKSSERPKSKKPLQPFHPTERIPADQAVDFPSDI